MHSKTVAEFSLFYSPVLPNREESTQEVFWNDTGVSSEVTVNESQPLFFEN